jgi:hypothetical protein
VRLKTWLAAAVLALGPVVAMPARADEAAAAAATPSPKRPLPDYRGQDAPPPSAGEVALWVPRVVLSPVYFTTEWLIRRPLGAAVSAAERAGLPGVIYDFFAFGPEHKSGVAPIAFVDFGFNPSVGLYGFWDDALVKGQDLRAHVSYWTDDWIGGSIVDRIKLKSGSSVQIKLLRARRPDHVFYGIGPTSQQGAQSRFREDLLDGSVSFEVPFWRASKIDMASGMRAATFADGHYGGDPGIVEQAARGAFTLPDGFARGYTAEVNNVRVALDSRRPFPVDGSGIRVEAMGEQGSDVRQSPGSGWLHYGAGAGAFLDLTGNRRVVSLSALVMFSDPLGGRPVPFTELVTLGGDSATQGSFPAPMPGFYPERMVGRSASVATLRYKWPIGPWIAGSLQAAVGNVFGEHLQGFDTRLLRSSYAFGVESDASPDSSFELLIGFGTDTFDRGGQVQSFRLAVGITRF